MTERLITLKQLSDIIGINRDTLRTYLQGYRFTKYWRWKDLFNYNADFVNTLTEFLYLKHKRELADNLKKKTLGKQELSV